jgi:hypothetical protein
VSLLVLVVLVKLPSCKKITNDYKEFTIKKGKHRSTYAFNYSKDTVFGWNIEFDSSAIYKCVDSLNQYDINKLIGWSDCGTDHMENSIRFGWRWLDDSLEIHWFKHEHGKFSFDLIKRVDLCKEHYYELTIFTWNYKLAVDGTYVYIPRNCPNEYRRYELYPYFGGNETAPHDIHIKIKKGTSL